jgi:hypothetical protein
MCDWKHWLVSGENIIKKKKRKDLYNLPKEWDYYDQEYAWRKLGLINRERDDIGF